MLKSIYTPLSGAVAQERVLETIANNLANLNTVGFKGDRVSFTLLGAEPENKYSEPIPPADYKVTFEDLQNLHGNDMAYVGISEIARDQAQGPAIQTGNPTDLMIEGEGYLRVQTPDGERYTRNGVLSVSPDGILTTSEGFPVMGDKGDIVLKGSTFQVNDQGEIWQDRKLVDKIKLFTFDKQEGLERVGLNYLFYGGAPEDVKPVALPQMRQGYLEGSNVNAIKNLTDMIVAHRSYEAYQKAVSNYDQIMQKSSNVIGEIRA